MDHAALICAAIKNRREAERSLAEIGTDIREDQAAAEGIFQNVAEAEALVQNIKKIEKIKGLTDELFQLRNQATDQLAACHDLQRQTRERIARLENLRAAFHKVVADSDEVIREAAQLQAPDAIHAAEKTSRREEPSHFTPAN